MIPSHVRLKLHEIEDRLRPMPLGDSPCCVAPFEPRHEDCGCVNACCSKCRCDYPLRECTVHDYRNQDH